MTAVAPAQRYVVRVMVLDAWDHVSVQVGPETTVAEVNGDGPIRVIWEGQHRNCKAPPFARELDDVTGLEIEARGH